MSLFFLEDLECSRLPRSYFDLEGTEIAFEWVDLSRGSLPIFLKVMRCWIRLEKTSKGVVAPLTNKGIWDTIKYNIKSLLTLEVDYLE